MGSDNAYRDSSGRGLDDYPRPSVAVDTALLTVDPADGVLRVLQVRRGSGHGWALPGTFLHPGERLIGAVRRSLREKAGIDQVAPRQLQVFDAPDRDDRGWVLSVAHEAVLATAGLWSRRPDTRLAPVAQPGRLAHDHAEIVDAAVQAVRLRYAARPDPDHLLGEVFTVGALRAVHEAVAGRALQKDTFRRAMDPHLAGTGEVTVGTRGRPAALFRRAQ